MPGTLRSRLSASAWSTRSVLSNEDANRAARTKVRQKEVLEEIFSELPGMISRLRSVGDSKTADILEIILREEVDHVAAGSRWFAWCCERDGADSRAMFSDLVDSLARGSLKGPFNVEARLRAGFTQAELAQLQILAA